MKSQTRLRPVRTSIPTALGAAAVAVALLGALGCGGGTQSAPPAAAPATSTGGGAASAAPATNGGMAPAAEPVEPVSSHGVPVGGEMAAPAAGGTGATGSIAWDLPAAWLEETPSSGMRMAQASIPGPGGPGQLVVFYFGPGGGGGVEANLDRWVGQMEIKPGTQPTRENFETNGYKVTMLDVSGTIQPSGMGMGPSTPQPESRMLAAVVEGPGGPWFFKATGPDATLGPARDDFRALLASVRAHG